MVPSRVLSRTNLARFSPSKSFTSSISFTSFRLPPLCISSPSFPHPNRLFSTTSSLFFQNTRGGGTLACVCEIAVQSFSVPSVPQWQIPFLRKSFRMNTYKSATKQTTLTSFRMNTYKKTGEGVAACGPSKAELLFARELLLATRHYFFSGGRHCRRRVRGLCCLRSFWRRRIALGFGRGSTGGCRCRRSLRPYCA
jgi:hypothetical protein